MKKATAALLILFTLLSLFAACSTPSQSGEKESSPALTSSQEQTELTVSDSLPSEPEDEEVQPKYEFGVYIIVTAEGDHKVSLDSKKAMVLDHKKEDNARFTLQVKERASAGKTSKFYAIYVGDNMSEAVGIDSFVIGEGEEGKLEIRNQGYNPTDKFLWTVEDYEDGTCRIVPKTSLRDRPICLAAKDGKVFVTARKEEDGNQLFKIEKAPEHGKYVEFKSAKGNFYTRVNRDLISKKTGVTNELMQSWTDYMQEAYEAEIALTGFVPYDLILFSGWENLSLAAGVSDNYCVITAGKGFAQSEFTKMASRNQNPKLNMIDMSFGFLHELGHMFDSNRGWNFESEAWTDLKLCYVVHKMTLDHEKTDGLVFGCASADFDASKCFAYEDLAEALDIHAKKGAMTTVYGFFGAARLFLLMAYDFGWEPFIKTFHWFQENGYTASSFERWERFTTFVLKLSEFSGKDIKNDYLTEENWEVFRKYYQGETTEAV